jgi:transcriptional regulator with XRE-family HTH domain
MTFSTPRHLTLEILAHAARQGLDQKALALRSGVPEVTISRLKQADDAKLSTLLRLARATGLRLALLPDDDLALRIVKGDLL